MSEKIRAPPYSSYWEGKLTSSPPPYLCDAEGRKFQTGYGLIKVCAHGSTLTKEPMTSPLHFSGLLLSDVLWINPLLKRCNFDNLQKDKPMATYLRRLSVMLWQPSCVEQGHSRSCSSRSYF
ncbi:orf121 (mitochondrion) [Beta vulgaris subsp. vulgaris]|uniref:Orf121 protein n=3 Tax=Beta TaxID=3554 RepID=Q9MF83_BETVV|nr:orf121 [Beta vulgaris subsp. vulgaris]YP_004222252.1 hypothetical protein LKY74_mgp152 [Beta vulgaris subsp. maritima]YP_004842059.1 hypothetical protein LKY79_mgp150 [Beta macrocarpa]CBJ14083.1 hypothetical protein [Beta vulgaris subsp. maritima]CBJ17492.1 hypothetical protein [Beta vulgaris subsp. maritima]CBJ20661.1 hypothetical protein [Beta vulgaris subsp. maritima]CBL52066.1 hypothetical protein [Beta vulgaris subsp. maritima]CBX24864.1 hypothetical protein [Beta macrocarpa]